MRKGEFGTEANRKWFEEMGKIMAENSARGIQAVNEQMHEADNITARLQNAIQQEYVLGMGMVKAAVKTITGHDPLPTLRKFKNLSEKQD